MHHRDRNAHRDGFTGNDTSKPWPKQYKPLLLPRIAPWVVAAITIIMLWSLK